MVELKSNPMAQTASETPPPPEKEYTCRLATDAEGNHGYEIGYFPEHADMNDPRLFVVTETAYGQQEAASRVNALNCAGSLPADAEGDDEDASYGPASYLPAPAADPAEAVEEEEWASVANENLQSALGRLDPRSRDILISRWTGDGKSTLHELAERYKVSAERIRQIESQALGKLKGMMVAEA